MSRIASAEWLRQEIYTAVVEVTGPDDPHAAAMSERIAIVLQRRIGGSAVYIPSAGPLRRQRILAEYTGRNIGELAARHGISRSAIYRMIKPAHRAAG